MPIRCKVRSEPRRFQHFSVPYICQLISLINDSARANGSSATPSAGIRIVHPLPLALSVPRRLESRPPRTACDLPWRDVLCHVRMLQRAHGRPRQSLALHEGTCSVTSASPSGPPFRRGPTGHDRTWPSRPTARACACSQAAVGSCATRCFDCQFLAGFPHFRPRAFPTNRAARYWRYPSQPCLVSQSKRSRGVRGGIVKLQYYCVTIAMQIGLL